jgi:hypothetical protein
MRGIKIALASTAVAASIVGSAYAAEACVSGPGADPSHHHGSPSATASATDTGTPPLHSAAFHSYRWTHHQYRHHHHRHFGWWRGWHAGWFWHHGKPARQHPMPTPSATASPSDTTTASAAPSPAV